MESDIDRKSPSELAFSESLVESVREGSGGAYSRAEAINRIKERTGNLGHRLLQYVADLEFLYKSDKINFDNVDEIDTDDGETPFGLWPNLWSIFPFIHHGDTVGDWYIWDNPSDLGISPDCNSDAVNLA